MEIISRKEALKQGLKYYYTGKPCTNGHVSERYTSAFRCVVCAADYIRVRYQTHRTYYNEKNSQHYRENFAYYQAYSREWKQVHSDRHCASQAKRRAVKLQATPAWADLDVIKIIYTEAMEMTKTTGDIYHVDHIVPLQSELVCGLHNQFNLEILPGKENIIKGNRYWPDMP